ncbi:hypothetical protein PanWU01x14_059740 [Parasponia andersonii]|uniref:Uncharacterized protein n=1 Tax=Parasponia andersonii TaxID=3476 RepID=A0A2P5DIM8_PARAD|nr:hypothetical protein PanWU01x14_059740 [Parasponia andersonii]
MVSSSGALGLAKSKLDGIESKPQSTTSEDSKKPSFSLFPKQNEDEEGSNETFSLPGGALVWVDRLGIFDGRRAKLELFRGFFCERLEILGVGVVRVIGIWKSSSSWKDMANAMV